MASRTEHFLKAHKVTQTEVGQELGLEPSSISRKLSGSRPWKLDEIQRLLAYLSTRLNRPVAYEEVFGAPAAAPTSEAAR